MTKPDVHPIRNPFKPGAGHMPPYLAGREAESEQFERILKQTTILENLVLTGLRGIGKTVLLETFKPEAISKGWHWVGTDLSESSSITEESLAIRLLTDLSVVTSGIVVHKVSQTGIGFNAQSTENVVTLNYSTLRTLYDSTPGLVSDKLKAVLEYSWLGLQSQGKKGLIFAYDEAQNLADHAARDQYPLSLLLDIFQSIQRKGIPFMLVLTGLPTLFPKLVEARTYAERMFRVVFLEPLNKSDTSKAINKPIAAINCPVSFTQASVDMVWTITQGYPYFVQYVCREVFDVWVQNLQDGHEPAGIPINEIMAKLDTDFFAGRWARATDRQQELMSVIALLPNADGEFSVREIEESVFNKDLPRPFSNSNISQMLSHLSVAGLIYKNRYGRYSFAVPLLHTFISRQAKRQNSG